MFSIILLFVLNSLLKLSYVCLDLVNTGREFQIMAALCLKVFCPKFYFGLVRLMFSSCRPKSMFNLMKLNKLHNSWPTVISL